MTGTGPLRVAVVTNLAAHYRLPLYRRLAARLDTDFFFTRAGSRRYWSPEHTESVAGLRAYPGNRPLALAAAIARGRYDCVVIGLVGRLTLLAAVAGTKVARRPYVLWVGVWARPETRFHRLAWPLVRFLMRDADALLVYGSHVARFVEDEAGRRDGVFEAFQAVDNDLFASEAAAAAGNGHSDLRALFVGRLEPEKGLDDLLAALALTSPQVTLDLAGSGTQETALREQARALGVADRVRFLGYVAQGNLREVYAQAHVLVLPSVTTDRFREPWGLVANEAMNAGLPVLATDAVGAAAGGLIVDRESGLVVPEREPRHLAAALDELAADRVLVTTLGTEARQRVRRWTHAAAEAEFVHAIDTAVARRERQ